MEQIFVLATRNKGKTREFAELLKKFPVTVKNLDDFGPIPEIEEDRDTFDGNAYKKSSATARILGFPAIADDSGLVVEALNGAPGVMSARYAGKDATDRENFEKVLWKMQGIDNRRAFFQCVISIAVPQGAALTYEGTCEGEITDQPAGENGFGYDPVFFCPEYGKTFARLSMEEKNRVSHRGRALAEMVDEFDKILKWIEIHQPQESPCPSGHNKT